MKRENSISPSVFKVSREGIEISGDEQFVRDQINQFKSNIEHYLLEVSKVPFQAIPLLTDSMSKNNLRGKLESSGKNTDPEDIEFVDVAGPTNIDYDNVLVIQNGKVQIITDVPGDTIVKRMINIILIYMWGKLQINDQEIQFTELREICEKHGDLDKSNFAKHMSAHKKYFIITGTGKYQQATLIRPGIKEAVKLIIELNKD
jgi:hypothetical protein